MGEEHKLQMFENCKLSGKLLSLKIYLKKGKAIPVTGFGDIEASTFSRHLAHRWW
jgi:hypothetical protein